MEEQAPPDWNRFLAEISEDEFDDDLVGDEQDRALINTLTDLQRERLFFQRDESRRFKNDRRRAIIAQKEHWEAAHGVSSADLPRTASHRRKRPRTDDDSATSDEDQDGSYRPRKSREETERVRKRQALNEIRERRREKGRRGGVVTQDSDDDYDPDAPDGDFSSVYDDEKYSNQADFATRSDRRGARTDGLDAKVPLGATTLRRPEHSEPTDLLTIHQAQVRRKHVIRTYLEPYFERWIVGMYVRVYIGNRKDVPLYRVARVERVDAIPDRPYTITGGSEDTVCAYLVLSLGNSERPMSINKISDSPILDSEFTWYRECLERASMRLPSREAVLDQVHRAKTLQHTFVRDSEAVKQYREMRDRFIVRARKRVAAGNLTMKRVGLQLALDVAQRDQRSSEAQELAEQIQMLDAEDRRRRQLASTLDDAHDINERVARLHHDRRQKAAAAEATLKATTALLTDAHAAGADLELSEGIAASVRAGGPHTVGGAARLCHAPSFVRVDLAVQDAPLQLPSIKAADAMPKPDGSSGWALLQTLHMFAEEQVKTLPLPQSDSKRGLARVMEFSGLTQRFGSAELDGKHIVPFPEAADRLPFLRVDPSAGAAPAASQ